MAPSPISPVSSSMAHSPRVGMACADAGANCADTLVAAVTLVSVQGLALPLQLPPQPVKR